MDVRTNIDAAEGEAPGLEAEAEAKAPATHDAVRREDYRPPDWLVPDVTLEFDLDPDTIAVSFNGSEVCRNGVGVPGAREVDLSGADIHLLVDLGIGSGTASIRTTDLSHAYVEENSAYSS